MKEKITSLGILLFLLVAEGILTPLHGADNLKASLITCWPGKEVYELYGHTALRIQGTDDKGEPFDSVWNYGVFNYSEPNFVGRFVKGELNYKVVGYPFAWFMPEYQYSGRRVEEQVLNLSQPQIQALLKALQTNALPQNATYLYDYVKDNCSTRVWDKIEAASGGITLPHQQLYPTYREAMRAYHHHYPWYSLGIDVALAYPVDTLINDHDQLFLPIVLHDKLAGARLSNGAPAVADTNVLTRGLPDATLPPTPWYASPLFFGWAILALAIIYCLLCRRRQRLMNWLEALSFGIAGVAGCIVAYLVFISIHRAASPNLLLVWLNPLDLLVPALVWSRRTRPIAVAYMIAQAIAIIFVAIFWPFQTQSGNAVFIPLLLTDLLLAFSYAALYFRNRQFIKP